MAAEMAGVMRNYQTLRDEFDANYWQDPLLWLYPVTAMPAATRDSQWSGDWVKNHIVKNALISSWFSSYMLYGNFQQCRVGRDLAGIRQFWITAIKHTRWTFFRVKLVFDCDFLSFEIEIGDGPWPELENILCDLVFYSLYFSNLKSHRME